MEKRRRGRWNWATWGGVEEEPGICMQYFAGIWQAFAGIYSISTEYRVRRVGTLKQKSKQKKKIHRQFEGISLASRRQRGSNLKRQENRLLRTTVVHVHVL